MDLERINSLIKDNENELRKINEKKDEYASFSEQAQEERRKFLEEENSKLRSFIGKYNSLNNEIKELEETKEKETDRKKIKEITEKIKEKRKDLKIEKHDIKKFAQGRTRNVVSSLIGQIDKRVSNLLYKNNTLWSLHTRMVEKRYSSPIKYLLKNGLIMIGSLSVAGLAVTLAPALAPLMTVVGIANGVFLVNTVVKGVSAIYNNYKYGGHLPFERKKDIQKGSFIENIKNSLFKRRRASLINNKRDIKTESIPVTGVKEDVHIINEDDKKSEKVKNDFEKAIDALKTVSFEKDSFDDLSNVYWRAKRFEDRLPKDVLDNYNRIKEIIDGRSKDDVKETKEEVKIDTLKEEEKDTLKEKEKNLETIETKDVTKIDNLDKPIVNDVKRKHKSSKVRNFIAKVRKLDPNNLDKDMVKAYLLELDSFTEEEKNQVPKYIYNILSMAIKMSNVTKEEKDVTKNVYESELNMLVERVDLNKIREVLKNKSLGRLSQRDKVILHDELVDIRNILDIISSSNVKNTALEGENISKLNEIVKLFGESNVKVNKVIPNRVKIELFDVTDQSGRNLVRFSGNCVFYVDDNKAFERMISFDSDDTRYIEDRIRKEIYGFDGEIIIKKNSKSL